MTRLFVALSAALLILVGVAAAKDANGREYLSIQQQYQQDYPGATFNVQIQQLFPVFNAASIGTSFRVERCISCHVPDITTVGPEVAAQRLAQDFFKYAPDATQLAKDYHLTGIHPAYVTANGGTNPASVSYAMYGNYLTNGSFPYTYTPNGSTTKISGALPGFLPSFLDPSTNPSKEGIDTIGCIICHNGNRLGLSLDPNQDAHQNLIINPVYSFTQGAALYYKSCATCHGGQGEGGAGPPLSNQDRLGFYNEDYYYRCIEFGFTDFEHLGSIMPNWGSIAPDFHPVAGGKPPNSARILSEVEIRTLIQFIRHWENYTTLP